MSNRDLISLGLPVYNSANRDLKKTLEGLTNQTYRNLEIIICDNASTDGTDGLCKEFAKSDPRIKYYRNEGNLGTYKNFWRTFNLSLGSYFKWCADDDTEDSTFIEKCHLAMSCNSDIALTSSRFYRIELDGTKELFPYDFGCTQELPLDRFTHLLKNMRTCDFFYGLWRRNVLEQMRHIDDDCMHSDQVFLCEAALLGKIVQLDEPLRTMSISPVWRKSAAEGYSAIYDKISAPSKHARGITFPIYKMLYELLEGIRYSNLVPEDKSKAMSVVRREYLPRWNASIANELNNALLALMENDHWRNWGEKHSGICLSQDTIFLYHFYAVDLLKKLEEVAAIHLEDFPQGLYLAKSICLVRLKRFQEALCSLDTELNRFPTNQHAISMREQVLAAI